MTRYEQGFLTKCAEYGVDGRKLLEKIALNSNFKNNVIQVPHSNFKNIGMQIPQRAPLIDMDGFFQFTDKVIKNPLLNNFKYQWRRFKNNTNQSTQKNRSPYQFEPIDLDKYIQEDKKSLGNIRSGIA